MKKTPKRLTLHRETVGSLDRVTGGTPTFAPTCRATCGGTAGGACATEGSYNTCGASAWCSSECATGGTACTGLTCNC